jgi:hypothetical protein
MKRVGSPNSAGMIPMLPSVVSAGTPEVLKPTPEPRGRVTAPSFGGTSSVETAAAEIEAAPAERPLAAAPAGDSLTTRMVDSTSHKALQGILTTVSGSEAPPVKTPPKR